MKKSTKTALTAVAATIGGLYLWGRWQMGRQTAPEAVQGAASRLVGTAGRVIRSPFLSAHY